MTVRVMNISGPISVVIDGLHIRNGNPSVAYGGSTEHQSVRIAIVRRILADGCGILAENGAIVTITRSSIYSNSAVEGGGIAAKNSNVTITGGSTVNDNIALRGGGVSVRNVRTRPYPPPFATTLTITGASSVYKNLAVAGGGGLLAQPLTTLIISNQSSVYENQVRDAGMDSGGGISLNGAILDMMDASIYRNSAPTGGGIGLFGGVYPSLNRRWITLRRVSIYSNRARAMSGWGGWGGGMHISCGYPDNPLDSALITDQTKIYDNWAGATGGGVRVYGCQNFISMANRRFMRTRLWGDRLGRSRWVSTQ